MHWKGTVKVCLWNELMIELQRWTEQCEGMVSEMELGLAGILTKKFVFIGLVSQACICC